jgi:Lysylphosphatidylglycerol synthase TM region
MHISDRWKTAIKMVIGTLGGYLTMRLIQSTGWSRIVTAFRQHGSVLLVITLIYVTFHLLRTLSLKICLPHKTPFWSLFAVRLAGEAISYIAIGSILGDTMKVVLAREKIPVVEGATGVFAEKLIYHLTGAIFLIGGVLIAVGKLGFDRKLFLFLIIAIGFFLVMIHLLSSGVHPLSRLLKKVRVRSPKLREAVLRTETNLFQFRKDHPYAFLFTLIIDLICYFYASAEVFFLLYVLGMTPRFVDIWYFEAVVKMSNSATVLVPANLGVFEATNLYLAKQLGFGGGTGLIVALFVRIRAIVWAMIGYSIFLVMLSQPSAQQDIITDRE